MAFLPHGISHSLKAMLIPMLHVCLAVQIADARSQDFTTCKLIILSLLLNVVSKNLLQPLLLLALGTSDSHIKRVFNLVKTRLNRFKRPNNFEFCFGDHICTYLCWTVSVSPQSRFVIAKRFGADGNSILHSWVQVPMSSVSNQIRSKQL